MPPAADERADKSASDSELLSREMVPSKDEFTPLQGGPSFPSSNCSAIFVSSAWHYYNVDNSR